MVHSPEQLMNIIPRAFELALSERPRPVLIDVPKNVQIETVKFGSWPEPGRKLLTVKNLEDVYSAQRFNGDHKIFAGINEMI